MQPCPFVYLRLPVTKRRKWPARSANLFRVRSFSCGKLEAFLAANSAKRNCRSSNTRPAKFVKKNATRKRGAAVKSKYGERMGEQISRGSDPEFGSERLWKRAISSNSGRSRNAPPQKPAASFANSRGDGTKCGHRSALPRPTWPRAHRYRGADFSFGKNTGSLSAGRAALNREDVRIPYPQ